MCPRGRSLGGECRSSAWRTRGWGPAVSARRIPVATGRPSRDERRVAGPAADDHEVVEHHRDDEVEDEAADAAVTDDLEDPTDEADEQSVDDEVLARPVELVHPKAAERVQDRADEPDDHADDREAEDARIAGGC